MKELKLKIQLDFDKRKLHWFIAQWGKEQPKITKLALTPLP